MLPAFVRSSLFALTLIIAAACSGSSGDEIADDSTSADALSGGVAIGAELVTTSNVNLRRGPGTDQPAIRVLDAGTTVVAVNSTTPTGSFYNVKAGADEGWVH